MAPTPDREAFLRRLEQQQQQQQQNEKQAQTQKPEANQSPDDLEVKDSDISLQSKISSEDEHGVDDNEVLQYLSEQCGLPVSSLSDIDNSSMEIFRQITPQKAFPAGPSISKSSPIEINSKYKPKPPDRCELFCACDPNDAPTRTNASDEKTEGKKAASFSQTNNSKSSTLRTVSGITIPEKSDPISSSNNGDNNVDPLPPALSAQLTAPGSPEWQVQLLQLLEKQNKILLNTRNQVESLEKQIEHLQSLLQTHTGTPTLTTRLPPAENNSPLEEGMFHKIQERWTEILEKVQRTRTGRAIRHAFNEGRRQNIHANLDVMLFLKMIFFVIVFSGKKHDSNDKSFMGQYRLYVYALFATFAYFLQTGVIGFLYTFLTKDLKRLEAEDMEEEQRRMREQGEVHGEENNGVNEDIDMGQAVNVQEEGALFNEALERNQQNDNQDGQQNDANVAAPNRMRRNLTDGGIDNEDGILHDFKYFVGSFILSLIPTWRPERVEEETVDDTQEQPEHDDGNGEEFAQRVE